MGLGSRCDLPWVLGLVGGGGGGFYVLFLNPILAKVWHSETVDCSHPLAWAVQHLARAVLVPMWGPAFIVGTPQLLGGVVEPRKTVAAGVGLPWDPRCSSPSHAICPCPPEMACLVSPPATRVTESPVLPFLVYPFASWSPVLSVKVPRGTAFPPTLPPGVPFARSLFPTACKIIPRVGHTLVIGDGRTFSCHIVPRGLWCL